MTQNRTLCVPQQTMLNDAFNGVWAQKSSLSVPSFDVCNGVWAKVPCVSKPLQFWNPLAIQWKAESHEGMAIEC